MSHSRRLKVLQVTPALYFGGAEKVISHLARGADRERYEVEVCCTWDGGPLCDVLRENGIRTHVAPRRAGRLAKYAASAYLWRTIRRFAPDVVHSHGITALFQLAPLVAGGQLPVWVHTYHYGNYPYTRARYMLAERWFSRLPEVLVAVGTVQRAAIIRHHGLAPERIVTIPNGVVDGAGRSAEVRALKRRELGVSDDAVLVGSIAVLTEQKGIPYLVEAARQLRDGMPHLRFAVVGGGPLEGAFRHQAHTMGLDTVTFTGWRADVWDLLQAFDMFVMPSLWEAMPLALLEAMAARLPIIATDVGENRIILQDGEAGIVVAPGSASALAEAIAAIARCPTRATGLATKARDRFEGEYTVSRMVTAYQDLYERRVRGGRA